MLIFATVFERMEIKTVTNFSQVEKRRHRGKSRLVNNNVFDNTAKPVMSIGPKVGWKLVA